MSRIPGWAKKPVVKGSEVIATDKGWERVVENGRNELLRAHKDLDKHLAELAQEVADVVGVTVVEVEETETVVVTEKELSEEE